MHALILIWYRLKTFRCAHPRGRFIRDPLFGLPVTVPAHDTLWYHINAALAHGSPPPLTVTTLLRSSQTISVIAALKKNCHQSTPTPDAHPWKGWSRKYKIFKLVSYCATRQQWASWLVVPLEHAAAHGDLDLVNLLLGAGANCGMRTGCRGRTLLNAAALGGNADVLTALVRAGEGQKNVDWVPRSTCDRKSALYTATFCGHEDAARVLIRAGANVSYHDREGEFGVLHEAAGVGHELLEKDLLKVLYSRPTPTPPQQQLITAHPSHRAVREGHDGMSTLLLGGVKKDATDKSGASPQMLAASEDHLSVVSTLLWPPVRISTDIIDGEQNSALDVAAWKGNILVRKTIVGHGADVIARDYQGATAIPRAAENNQACTIDAGRGRSRCRGGDERQCDGYPSRECRPSQQP